MTSPTTAFELLLFTIDPALVRRAVAAGVDGIIVDWERRGKDVRQAAHDTQINHDTPEDLGRVRRATSARVICRINGIAESTTGEIETAIAAGADEILLPMVRSAREVEHVLDQVRGRCGVGILIETVQAAERAAAFAALPLARVYVGLNDLAIERRTPNIFSSVADGTVERIRQLMTAPFGFGGLTLPEHGHPVPCRLLIDEMVRLDCRFSFLRRSFLRDARDLPLDEVVARIRQGLADARDRASDGAIADRRPLEQAIAGWDLARVASD
ncbi:MAG TPA: hypothetical protein VMM93_00150 [Vicinamibacterales bacterium]|nr:hypothetical protein [Vicinamibacterales bacterium]